MFKINGIEIADVGFYINLDESTDRDQKVKNQIDHFNIEGFKRFSALRDDRIQYSCTKSHLQIFENSLKEGYEIVFVSEDDFDIRNEIYSPFENKKLYFNERLKSTIEDLKEVDWDIVLFGCNPKTFLIPVTDNLAEVNKSTGAWAYIIKKDAMRYILENLNYNKDLLAIDDFLPIMNSRGFKTLCTTPILINHGIGFESTLQPQGPVNYDTWIEGNFNKFFYSDIEGYKRKFEFEKNVTIVITGHYTDNFLFYLNYLLYSLPKSLLKCRFIINYDEDVTQDLNKNRYELYAYFRDKKSDLNVDLTFSNGGLISSFNNFLKKIKTPYFIFLEHDWVFLERENIDFQNLLNVFKNYNYVNAVWFSKDDNILRGFDIAEDKNKNVTPFIVDERISELNLVTTCRWSNNPVMLRTSKMIFWYDNYVKNEYVGKMNQGPNNVEESLISEYRKQISQNEWEEIKDEWGTFLYGSIGEGPFVAHTDASKRYQSSSKSQPEINGENYIKNNPIEI